MFCAALGARASLFLVYHPQSSSQRERTNLTLENALLCVAARHPAMWSSYLPWGKYAKYAHNSLIPSTSVVSPFMTFLGYQPTLFDYHEE